MEVAPFFVDFHHFLSIFTIFYRFSRFTHFCRDLHFVAIYALFPQFFFGQNSLLRNITRFCMYAGMCTVHITLSGLSCQLMRISQTVDQIKDQVGPGGRVGSHQNILAYFTPEGAILSDGLSWTHLWRDLYFIALPANDPIGHMFVSEHQIVCYDSITKYDHLCLFLQKLLSHLRR